MATTKKARKINRYSTEFKVQAVQLSENPDIIAKDVARELGIHPILLYRWRKEYRDGKFTVKRTPKKSRNTLEQATELIQIGELRREIEKLRKINGMLKETITLNQAGASTR